MRRVVAMGCIATLCLAGAGAGYFFALPSVGDAPARVAAILAAHHALATHGGLPPRLAAAVVATEDEHFYANVVYDVGAGIGRAAVAWLQGSRDPGGSTIAQQLAKQLYGDSGGWTGTLRDLLLGIKLATRFPRHEILSMYLNVSYYGHGYWGARAAAWGYFRTTPGRLTWAQASLLAGLLQAPSAYDPLRHLALAKARQREVLAQLVANDDVSAAQAARVFHEPLGLVGHRAVGQVTAAARQVSLDDDRDGSAAGSARLRTYLRWGSLIRQPTWPTRAESRRDVPVAGGGGRTEA